MFYFTHNVVKISLNKLTTAMRKMEKSMKALAGDLEGTKCVWKVALRGVDDVKHFSEEFSHIKDMSASLKGR